MPARKACATRWARARSRVGGVVDGGAAGGGVVGLDGHSDCGAVFREFADRHLDDAVGARTTLFITGDEVIADIV